MILSQPLVLALLAAGIVVLAIKRSPNSMVIVSAGLSAILSQLVVPPSQPLFLTNTSFY